MICSDTLANEARSVYDNDMEFVYDHVAHSRVVVLKKDTDTRVNIKVDA